VWNEVSSGFWLGKAGADGNGHSKNDKRKEGAAQWEPLEAPQTLLTFMSANAISVL
jgi:hypothetical protein